MTDTTRPKISARSVERVFAAETDNPVHALGPFDLDIADGEFCCIVGPSGCGKSTFLRIVAGLLRPSAGAVEVDLAGTSKTPIAMVFQDYGIYPWKTVEANVRFGLEVGGMSKRDAREKALFWLGRLGLTEFRNAYPDKLSGGMRQRVAIARALAVEPEILLMDEPFAALDAQLRQILQEELLALWEADKRTVLFITHSLEEAIVLGDRVLVMTARPGRMLESVQVPFDRPRTPELRAEPEFNEFKAGLWDHLKLQVEQYLNELRTVEEEGDER
ncbi:MAG: nitrate ABC transporter ATP-binding protein [Acidimicrobiales bacterium]|nr:MAG: nitrate ABC transporter ATP-binding protein [Acidimicrobiales bacterium]